MIFEFFVRIGKMKNRDFC